MEHARNIDDFTTEEEKERFKVSDPQGAMWVADRIREADNNLEKIKYMAKSMLAAAEARHKNDIAWWTMHLEEYFDTLPKRETKTQEVFDFIPGMKMIRKKPTTKLVKDDAALLDYLKKQNMSQYIKVEETPMWGEFKKGIEEVSGLVVNKETKEIVKGVTVEDVPAEFVVKVEG